MGKRGILGICTIVWICHSGNQLLAQRNRLTSALDNKKRVPLAGHMQPLATPANDQGLAEADLTLGNLTMALQPSPEQQAALEAFLAWQQDPSSPDFHHWLTPEEYADRFGLSQPDLDRITAWLRSQNLNVISVARGRNSIQFSGPVRQVESAFQTQIHRYMVNGERHFANASEPTVPAALTGIVMAIRGLNDFRPKARKIRYTSGVDGTHYLTPDDIAAIYNVRPLHNAGIDGTGQKMAIVGQTQIDVGDIRQFRTAFNLPTNDPQVVLVPGLPDPGISKTGDLGEADLDLEWSGAVARNATLIYVYSKDVTDAAIYAIGQNLAPVMSMSYGLCEAQTPRAQLASLQMYAQQANAQGM
ncbi:MAG: protease pro-enzyme activation domain-containing protein, partial [Acidobacteriota bacterium]